MVPPKGDIFTLKFVKTKRARGLHDKKSTPKWIHSVLPGEHQYFWRGPAHSHSIKNTESMDAINPNNSNWGGRKFQMHHAYFLIHNNKIIKSCTHFFLRSETHIQLFMTKLFANSLIFKARAVKLKTKTKSWSKKGMVLPQSVTSLWEASPHAADNSIPQETLKV